MAKNVQNSHFSFARIFILVENMSLRSSPLHEAAERYAQFVRNSRTNHHLKINIMSEEKVQKTYKTELLIAIITAITGVSIAIISNWEKFKYKEKSEKNFKQVTDSLKAENKIQFDFPGHEIMHRTQEDAENKFKKGYDIDLIQMSDISPIGIHPFYFSFNSRTKYILSVSCDNPNAMFSVQLINSPTKDTTDTFNIKDAYEMEITPDRDFNAFYITLHEQEFPEKIAVIISSR
jgi:hypothetical protein